MPLPGGKSFDEFVEEVKRKQGVSNESARKIVGSIEKKTKRAKMKVQLMILIAKITKGNTTFNTLSPEDIIDVDDIEENIKPIKGTKAKGEFTPARKVALRADKPQDRRFLNFRKVKAEESRRNMDALTNKELSDMEKIIQDDRDEGKKQKKQAKKQLAKMRNKVELIKFKQANEHIVEWHNVKTAKGQYAALVEENGKFAKYWLLNAKDTNGNGWGVSQTNLAKNIMTFIDRPFVITSNTFIKNSMYGKVYDHPHIPTNDMNLILAHQERFRVANIVDIHERDGQWFAIIERDPKYAHLTLPAFCSPAIYQLDALENESNLTKWTGLHLAGLDENPAYGSQIALLRGSCDGPKGVCMHQLKEAKLHTAAIGIELGPEGRRSKIRKFKNTSAFIENAGEGDRKQREDRMNQELNFINTGKPIRPKGTSLEVSRNLRKKLSKLKLAAVGLTEDPDRRDKIDRFLAEDTQGDRALGDAITNPKRFKENFKGMKNFVEKGIKINPKLTETGMDLDEDVRKKLAALRSQTNSVVNRVNVLGVKKRRRRTLGAFQEPTTTFSNSFRKKKILEKFPDTRRIKASLQKTAALNQQVIDAFRKGKPMKSNSFSTDGKTFNLFGHPIAKNTSRGLAVSTAGFPTSKTFDTLRSLGVNVRTQKGITRIGDKQIDPKKSDFHLVPKKELSNKKVFFSTPEQREKLKIKNKARGGNEAIREQRNFREKLREQTTGSKKKIPNDPTVIQPKDQEKVNLITGVKSPVGPAVKGPETHHIFFKNKQPGLSQNTLNAIPLSKDQHTELHRLNAKIKLQKLSRAVGKDETDPLERARFDEQFGDIQQDESKTIPPVRVDTFTKFPETKKITKKDKRFGEPIFVPMNTDVGMGDVDASPLGEKVSENRLNRRLKEERGTSENFMEMFKRKFGQGRFDKPTMTNSLFTIRRDKARKFAKLKLALTRKPSKFVFDKSTAGSRFTDFDVDAPLRKEVPFGTDIRKPREQMIDRKRRTVSQDLNEERMKSIVPAEVNKRTDLNFKINSKGEFRPKKPTQKDRARIIEAKGINCTPCTKLSMSKLKLALRIKYAAKALPLSGAEIVRRFQKVKNQVPKGKGFTFIPETGKLIDATSSPEAAMELRKELGSPANVDTFLDANTRDITNEKDLIPNLDRIKGRRLIGGFVDKAGNVSLDATTPVFGGTIDDDLIRLKKEKQVGGIRISPKGETEFFDVK